MGTSRFWIGRQDLSVAMRELSQILSLDLNGEYIDGLDEALNETWHGSTYDQGKIVPGPWMTLVHHGDPNLQVEMAQDECGGVSIKLRSAESEFARVKAALIKFNKCIESAVYKSESA